MGLHGLLRGELYLFLYADDIRTSKEAPLCPLQDVTGKTLFEELCLLGCYAVCLL
jgi:hypothetical protein